MKFTIFRYFFLTFIRRILKFSFFSILQIFSELFRQFTWFFMDCRFFYTFLQFLLLERHRYQIISFSYVTCTHFHYLCSHSSIPTVFKTSNLCFRTNSGHFGVFHFFSMTPSIHPTLSFPSLFISHPIPHPHPFSLSTPSQYPNPRCLSLKLHRERERSL